MAVVQADLKLYASANNPADDTSTLGGAIDTGTQITGSSIGELFNKKAANAGGGADKTTYGKAFYKNTNGTDSFLSGVVWVENGLIAPSGDGIFSIVSDSASDDTTKYVKLIYCSSGTYTTENVTLNGTSSVVSSGSADAGELINIELRLVADDSLTTATGDITITRGSQLGIIPAGYKNATGCYALGLAASLNDTATTTDRLTAPGAISFSYVNTEAGAISCAATMTAGDGQGIWIRQILPAGMASSADLQLVLRISGTDS